MTCNYHDVSFGEDINESAAVVNDGKRRHSSRHEQLQCHQQTRVLPNLQPTQHPTVSILRSDNDKRYSSKSQNKRCCWSMKPLSHSALTSAQNHPQAGTMVKSLNTCPNIVLQCLTWHHDNICNLPVVSFRSHTWHRLTGLYCGWSIVLQLVTWQFVSSLTASNGYLKCCCFQGTGASSTLDILW